jgi:hypothetical protein
MQIQAPVLKNILKRLSSVKADSVVLDTTLGIASVKDRDLTVVIESAALRAEHEREQQVISVNRARLSAATSRMTGAIKLTPSERSLAVESGKSSASLEVFKGEATRLESGQNPVTLPWSRVLGILSFASVAAEADIAAPFGGVVEFLTKGDNYQAVATDGSGRVALAATPSDLPLESTLHIPLSIIRALHDLSSPEVTLSSTESALIFTAVEGDLRITLQVAKLARTFPPYERILPKAFTFTATLQPAEVKSALDTVKHFVGKEVSGVEDGGAVYLTFSGGTVTVSSLGVGNKAEDTASYTADGLIDDPLAEIESTTYCLRHDFLADFFGAAKEPVLFSANGHKEAVVLSSGPYKVLISSTIFNK